MRLREPSRFFQSVNTNKVTVKSTSETSDAVAAAAAAVGAVSAVTVLQKSDVYSFAIILNEIYSRFTPAQKVSVSDTMQGTFLCGRLRDYRMVPGYNQRQKSCNLSERSVLSLV